MGSINPGVCALIDRNEILIIERNIPVVTPNKPQRNQINRLMSLSSNRRKQMFTDTDAYATT
jgi:hypothetical protein